ncbi:glycine cleavage system protein GcvH [Flavobacterium sp. RHBU_24]|uniref:glycine cleavage system protein GcvH n=1 Tax=Flavobacterium sp. RHBU_24 TaxID=3391185 RepID=UPI0039848DAC
MNFPEDVKYHSEHTWIKVDGETGIIGITDFAQKELGEIVYVDLPNVGSSFESDEVFGTVEAVKTVSDLFIPVAGTVIALNDALLKAPTLVNTDPFGKGWMLKIELKNPAEIDALLSCNDYKAGVGSR